MVFEIKTASHYHPNVRGIEVDREEKNERDEYYNTYYIEIETLKDLLDLIKKSDCNIILGACFNGEEVDASIMIYDDYIE